MKKSFVNKRKNVSIILYVLLVKKRTHLFSARRTTHSKRSYADDLHSQKRTKKPRKRAKRISISIAQRLLFLSLSSLLSLSLFLSLFFCLFFSRCTLLPNSLFRLYGAVRIFLRVCTNNEQKLRHSLYMQF